MTLRFICPHCHSPLDPLTMDNASTVTDVRLRICPDCDEPIVLAVTAAPALSRARNSAPLAENATR